MCSRHVDSCARKYTHIHRTTIVTRCQKNINNTLVFVCCAKTAKFQAERRRERAFVIVIIFSYTVSRASPTIRSESVQYAFIGPKHSTKSKG